jgi:uncharacterized protein
MLEYTLFAIAGLMMVIGIIGCFVPYIPGPPLSFIGLLALHYTKQAEFSIGFLLMWAVITIIVSILDYMIPIWGARKFGGTKAGMWGAAIGLIIGIIIFPPWGMIIGTALGAFIGEILVKRDDFKAAFVASMGALAGFILGTALKIAVSFAMLYYLVKELVKLIW